MREDVKKFLFLGMEKSKQSFFEQAQSEGIIHFIDPNHSGRKDIPHDVQRLSASLRVLRGLPSQEQEENYSGLIADSIVDTVLTLSEKNEGLQERLRVNAMEISRIEAFGDFSFDDIDYIEKKGKCKIQFFCARPTLFDEIPEPENLVYVSSDHGLDYFISVSGEPLTYDRMIEMKFDLSLNDLKSQQVATKQELHEVEQQLKSLAKYDDYLRWALVEKLDHYHLYNAQTYVQETMGGKLFAVEGWVPLNKVNQLNKMIGEMGVYVEEIAIEETDVIPTYLENHGLSRLGEDLVHIYDTPSATDKDPSIWVLGAFTLFFAFIIGDAGYGMVYLLLALFLRYKYPNLKGAGKRVLNLFTLLCVGCVVWGTLMTSFFGMQIALDNPLRKFSVVQWLAEKRIEYHIVREDDVVEEWVQKFPELKHVSDPHTFVSYSPDPGEGPVILNRLTDNVMFELALFIGVFHLILSMLRYTFRNWHHLGWVAFLVGAYLYFPAYLGTPSILNFVGGVDLVKGGEVGLQLMFIGIGSAWLMAIIRNGWTGIFEITVVIQIFADTLSYLRLYALGLAGAIVASTINEIASGMPLIVGVLLIIVSHFINIVLSTMSGIIHGLRLNFLEWYHYSFEGGGRLFQPLKLLNKD